MRRNHTKKERLKRRSDINRVFQEGAAVSCSGARLRFVPNGLPCNRIVCIPVKKYGNAVARNRVKRHVREIYRLEKDHISKSYDLAIVVYPGKSYDFWERKAQILLLLNKAGLLKHNALQSV